jgi:hypothetical protein
MAEEAIPSAADPLQSRVSSTRLPSLAQLYAAQQLGRSLQSNSYTLPELYALEQTDAPLDLAPSPESSSPQQSQPPAPQDQSLPILADQSGAPLQPEPLTPGERLGGAVRAAGRGALGDLWDYGEAQARTNFGWQPISTQAQQAADAGFNNVGKVASHEDASYHDHLTDIKDASKRFSNAYPAHPITLGITIRGKRERCTSCRGGNINQKYSGKSFTRFRTGAGGTSVGDTNLFKSRGPSQAGFHQCKIRRMQKTAKSRGMNN